HHRPESRHRRVPGAETTHLRRGSRPQSRQPVLVARSVGVGMNGAVVSGAALRAGVSGRVPAGASLPNRRALEALRAGVPNRDAVAVLGSQQTAVEDRFTQMLAATDSRPAGEPVGGMLIGGGFGSGKSHVLEHLTHLALEAGF